MNEFKVIVVMNEAMLRMLKDKNKDYENNSKIKKYLQDEAVFFKISKTNAFKILRDVGVKQEMLEEVYKKLISPNIFYELLHEGKIKFDDDNLVVKYDAYNSDELFKRRK